MPEESRAIDTGPVRLVVFDVDGVLIDSYELVREAYSRAGVVMSEWAWGLHWKQWLPNVAGTMDEAIRVHDLKNDIYTEMLSDGEGDELAGAEVARRLTTEGYSVAACSSASDDAIKAILKRVNISIPYVSAAPKDKGWGIIKLMNIVFAGPRNTVYTDDIDYNGHLAAGESGAHFVSFVNDVEMLDERIKACF